VGAGLRFRAGYFDNEVFVQALSMPLAEASRRWAKDMGGPSGRSSTWPGPTACARAGRI